MSGRQETAGDYRLCPRDLPDTASYQAGRKEAECVNTAPHTSLIQALMDEDAAAVLREGKRGKHIVNIKLRFPAGLVFYAPKQQQVWQQTQIITDRQTPRWVLIGINQLLLTSTVTWNDFGVQTTSGGF